MNIEKNLVKSTRRKRQSNREMNNQIAVREKGKTRNDKAQERDR